MAITAAAASSSSIFTFNNSLSSAPPLTLRPVFYFSSLHLSVTGKLGVFTNYSGHRKPFKLKPPMCSVSVTESQPMVPPYNVLITGSTKGIGYALAKEFLKAGDNVIICSRSAERVESALQTLREESGVQHVWGTKCDVRDGNDVKNLVKYAQDNLQYVDIWINNAGSNAYSYKPLAEASDEDLIEVVTTNTLGLMICCREAMKMMLNQPRGGHIFNIDGAGSDGRPTPRFAAYGATKRSVVHLTKSLQAELRMQEVNNVVVHNLSVCCAFLAHINSYPSSHFPTHLQPLFDSSLHLRHPTTTFLVSLSLEVKKVVVIHDVLMSYVVQDVKTLTNAEMFVFQPPPAFYRACGLWEKAGGGQFPFNRTFPVERELMEKLPSKDGISSQEFRKLLEIQQSHMGSHVGELYDSSRVIEGEFIEYLEKDEINGKKKIWAVGPLNPIEISSKRTDSTSRHKCLQWLDKQPENSVMYVSFGTTTTFSEEQIRELALGLERSGQRFIWVVRVADTSNSVGSEERKIELPNGFEERVRGRGLIERSWAPQLEILEHSATGGFMSHCGWNSSMESISMGVPMATWPMHSDQPRNAFLITDVIKIGIAVKNWESRYELVKANVMADAINRLMASEEGAEIRRRAVKLGGEVKESVAEGGVRCREMDSFISYICS